MSKLYYNPDLDEVKSPSSIFAVYGLTVNESNAHKQGWFPYKVDRELTPQASEIFEIVATVKSCNNCYIGRTAIKSEAAEILLKLLHDEIDNKFDGFVADVQSYFRKVISDWNANTAYQVDDYALSPCDIDPKVIRVWRCTQANTGVKPNCDIDEWTTTTL